MEILILIMILFFFFFSFIIHAQCLTCNNQRPVCLTVKVLPRVRRFACAVVLLDLEYFKYRYYRHAIVIKTRGDTVSSRIVAHGVIQSLYVIKNPFTKSELIMIPWIIFNMNLCAHIFYNNSFTNLIRYFLICR